MLKYLTKYILHDYIFNLAITLVMFVVSLFLPYKAFCVMLPLSIGMALFVVYGFFEGVAKAKKIINKYNPDLEGAKYIENAIFTKDTVFGYNFRTMNAVRYENIMIAKYNENIHEKTRPGYKGNHKVVIQSKLCNIVIPVENEEIADTILNFIYTQNSDITFYSDVLHP